MKLSLKEFEKRYQNDELSIAFVGMSNIGKSYTAKRLAISHKFTLIEIDKIIWESLEHDSMEAFAAWQGHPYTAGYKARENKSIELEAQATLKALNQIEGNCLLDTTGSVIYTGDEVLNPITSNCLVVHIKAEVSDLERLKKDYFAVPKPLVWKDSYIEKDGLSREETIRTCYPNLLQSRKNAYESMADVTLASSFILAKETNEDNIIKAIKSQLTN